MKEFELDDNGKSYILIDDTTRLTITPRNWQLQKKQIAGKDSKEVGKVTWTAFRYYVSLQSALNDVIHIKTAQEDFKSVQELIEANAKVVNALSKSLSPTYVISEATS
jgi:hypothetical protein